MNKIFYFSATAGNKRDTLLYKNTDLDIFFKEDNRDSLQKTYNKAFDFCLQEGIEYIVLTHDDVIFENVSEEKLLKNFKQFDMFGVAGATQCKLNEPALWHLMGGGFNGGNLRGAVAHLIRDKKQMTSFGLFPHRVVMLDGVFLAISRAVFENTRFDESCPAGYHFYDVDYSLTAHKRGFKVGVGDILITHKSPGLTEFTEEFKKGEQWFLDKHK
jgi:GT2 family glycosyltransferase